MIKKSSVTEFCQHRIAARGDENVMICLSSVAYLVLTHRGPLVCKYPIITPTHLHLPLIVGGMFEAHNGLRRWQISACVSSRCEWSEIIRNGVCVQIRRCSGDALHPWQLGGGELVHRVHRSLTVIFPWQIFFFICIIQPKYMCAFLLTPPDPESKLMLKVVASP